MRATDRFKALLSRTCKSAWDNSSHRLHETQMYELDMDNSLQGAILVFCVKCVYSRWVVGGRVSCRPGVPRPPLRCPAPRPAHPG